MSALGTVICGSVRIRDVVRWSRVVVLLLLLAGRVTCQVQDSCDTTVWNTGGGAVGVHDVTGLCSEGRITWRSPYGAVRISLKLTSPVSGLLIPFEACFLASASHSTIKVFHEDSHSNLRPIELLGSSQPAMLKELCFVSPDGEPVVLYMESELETESATFGLVHVDYDNRRLPVWREGDEEPDDCRPCTESQIVEAVCSSDFVVAGTMDDVNHNAALEETSIHVKVNKVHRQRHDLFKDISKKSSTNKMSRTRTYPRLKFHTENGVLEWPQNDDFIASFSPTDSSQSEGVILAPVRCGIRAGLGEFLFVGRIRLKRAMLQCAPRLEDFQEIWQKAQQHGRNLCLLD